MDPNTKEQPLATSHVIIPAPSEPPVNSSDPQQEINTVLAESIPKGPPIHQPPEGQSLFAQMNSPQPGALPHQVPPDEKPGRKVSKKLALGILIVLVLVALPVTVFLTQQQQNIKQEAVVPISDETIIGIFNGTPILKKDLQNVAKEQYAPSAVDNDALKVALDTLIERKILDKEKQDKNIIISQSEIDEKIAQEDLSSVEANYAVLRERVAELNTKYWKAYTIGFWVPPANDLTQLTEQEKTERQQILTQGLNLINQAEQRMKGNDSVLSIAQALLTENPNFGGILAVNGVQVNSDIDEYVFNNPKTFDYQSVNTGQAFFDTLYAMKTSGEVKKAVAVDGTGASAIKLIEANPDAAFNTYNNWLSDRKNSLYAPKTIL